MQSPVKEYHNSNALSEAGIYDGDLFIYDSKLWVKVDRNAAKSPGYGVCSFHDVRPQDIKKIDLKDAELVLLKLI